MEDTGLGGGCEKERDERKEEKKGNDEEDGDGDEN